MPFEACCKEFTMVISPTGSDCGGVPSTLSGLVWVSSGVTQVGGGTISISGSGSSGSFSLAGSVTSLDPPDATSGGTLTAQFCNESNGERTLRATFTYDVTLEDSGSILNEARATISNAVDHIWVDQHPNPFTQSGAVVTSDFVIPACARNYSIAIAFSGRAMSAGPDFAQPSSSTYSLVGTFAMTDIT